MWSRKIFALWSRREIGNPFRVLCGKCPSDDPLSRFDQHRSSRFSKQRDGIDIAFGSRRGNGPLGWIDGCYISIHVPNTMGDQHTPKLIFNGDIGFGQSPIFLSNQVMSGSTQRSFCVLTDLGGCSQHEFQCNIEMGCVIHHGGGIVNGMRSFHRPMFPQQRCHSMMGKVDGVGQSRVPPSIQRIDGRSIFQQPSCSLQVTFNSCNVQQCPVSYYGKTNWLILSS